MYYYRTLTKYKPLFKKFLAVRNNIQNKKKLLKLKKKKWEILKNQYEKKLRFFKKFKGFNQNGYSVIKFPKKGNSYKKRYRNTMTAVKIFKLFYGNFLKKQLKVKINSTFKIHKKNKNIKVLTTFLKQFESRLDIVLYRSKICPTLRLAQHIIRHGKIKVNKITTKSKAYFLKPGDLIEIKTCFKPQLIEFLKDRALEDKEHGSWPHPPKYLFIDYESLQIIFGTINTQNFSLLFTKNLKIEKILLNFYKK